ncbi:hypothetical protein J3P96_19495 [Pseudomonas sp. R3-56]|uniref:DUF6124 family protein n=1 Tax=Pseudomonas sp. R3-56 TaxID=2817401 RepID=UPI003DA9F6D3
MVKTTPNPPEKAENLSGHPNPDTQDGQIFSVVADINTESILTTLSETLASANAMASDLAFDLEGSRRHVALGLQQLIELGTLLANRALDNIELAEPPR